MYEMVALGVQGVGRLESAVVGRLVIRLGEGQSRKRPRSRDRRLRSVLLPAPSPFGPHTPKSAFSGSLRTRAEPFSPARVRPSLTMAEKPRYSTSADSMWSCGCSCGPLCHSW